MIVNGQRGLHRDIDERFARIEESFAGIEELFIKIENGIADLREGKGRLEGLFEGFTSRERVAQ